MKVIKILIMTLLFAIIVSSCDDKSHNFSDPSIKTALDVIQIKDTLGTTYPLVVLRSFDTVFNTMHIKLDTLKDASGAPILNAQNKPQVTRDTLYTPRNKTSKFIELDTILLHSPKNEVQIKLQANARWQAPAPDFQGKIAWFQTQNVNGGGSSTIKVKVLTGLSTKRRPILANQTIYSRDSLVMYKLTFDQKAQNEK